MPHQRRPRRDVYLPEQAAEEAAIEDLDQGPEARRIGGQTELGWARGLDWAEQEQEGPTKRQRDAWMYRLYAVFEMADGLRLLRRLPKPASWAEVGFLLGVSKARAHELARMFVVHSGINPSDLDEC